MLFFRELVKVSVQKWHQQTSSRLTVNKRSWVEAAGFCALKGPRENLASSMLAEGSPSQRRPLLFFLTLYFLHGLLGQQKVLLPLPASLLEWVFSEWFFHCWRKEYSGRHFHFFLLFKGILEMGIQGSVWCAGWGHCWQLVARLSL